MELKEMKKERYKKLFLYKSFSEPNLTTELDALNSTVYEYLIKKKKLRKERFNSEFLEIISKGIAEYLLLRRKLPKEQRWFLNFPLLKLTFAGLITETTYFNIENEEAINSFVNEKQDGSIKPSIYKWKHENEIYDFLKTLANITQDFGTRFYYFDFTEIQTYFLGDITLLNCRSLKYLRTLYGDKMFVPNEISLMNSLKYRIENYKKFHIHSYDSQINPMNFYLGLASGFDPKSVEIYSSNEYIDYQIDLEMKKYYTEEYKKLEKKTGLLFCPFSIEAIEYQRDASKILNIINRFIKLLGI